MEPASPAGLAPQVGPQVAPQVVPQVGPGAGGSAGESTPRANPSRGLRGPARVAVSAVVLGAIVGARGFVVAEAVGGRARRGDMAVDGAIAALAIIALHVLAWGLERALRAALRPRSRLGGAAVRAAHAAALTALVLPLALVAMALHPPRIACTERPARCEDVRLVTSDGLTLAAWYLPQPLTEEPSVALVIPGLGANKQNFLPAAHLFQSLGYAVLIIDPRAHGDSAGRQSSLGLREALDVRAAWEWIAARHPGRPVVGVGYSMGGAALLRAAADGDLPFERIVLDSTYARAENVARERTLAWAGPLRGALYAAIRIGCRALAGFDPDDLRSDARIAEVAARTPVLIVHGEDDPIIPPAEADRLAAASGGRAEVYRIPGAAHVEGVLGSAYRQRLERFLAPATDPAVPDRVGAGEASGVR